MMKRSWLGSLLGVKRQSPVRIQQQIGKHHLRRNYVRLTLCELEDRTVPATPTITSFSPAFPVATGAAQTFTITGTNFDSTSTVTLRDIQSTGTTTYANLTISSRTATQIVINPNFGTSKDVWSVEVLNGTASSGQKNFVLIGSAQPVPNNQGVDYSFGRPTLSTLKGLGYNFAVRYVSPGSSNKNISATEAANLKAAGIDIILVFESSTNRITAGYDAGFADAQTAMSQGAAAGAPANFFCYFACDFDAQASDQTAINAYLDGAAAAMGGVSRVGLYAGYNVIKRTLDAGKASKGWQTVAWSGGLYDSRISLYQYAPSLPNVAGASVDVDVSYGTNYGQWSAAPSTPSTPTPANNATIIGQPSALSWAITNNTNSYDVYINGVFKQNATTNSWTPTLTFTPGVSQSWQIVSKGASLSTAGPTWHFTVQAPLAAPTLSSPANNATGVATQPTFTWSQVTGNAGYRIIVSTNINDLPTDPSQAGSTPSNGFNTTVSTNVTSYTWTGTLSNSTTYYWEVRALAAQNGTWSTRNSFTTVASAPSAPTNPNPTDGSILGAQPSALSWTATSNTSSYDVYINGVFNQNVTTNSWTPTGTFTPGSSQSWQVVAKGAGGSTAGAVWHFMVGVPATVQSVQVNDGNDQRSMVRSLTITFSGAVSFANNNPAAAFTLARIDGGFVGLVAGTPTLDGQGRTVLTLTFTGTAEIDSDSVMHNGVASLADGQYQLVILDGMVTGANGLALDGDNNGAAGGAYLSPTDTAAGGPGQLRLFRLFGDANGDGFVDGLDLLALRAAINTTAADPGYLAYLDANNDGFIDGLDLQLLRPRINTNLFGL
jgi:hypothetical protein